MKQQLMQAQETCLFFILYFLAFTKGKPPTLQATDFFKIAQSPSFVDKTLLIKEVIENNRTSVITAPPIYGKSVNIDMIKTFLEIEIDKAGNKKTKSNYSTEHVTDTESYKLFSKLKISKDTRIMNNLLGRTPVLSVSFKCKSVIRELDDVLKYFQLLVHQTFFKYYYLTKNGRLEDSQRHNIEKWCNDQEYVMFDKQKVLTALRELTEYLYYYFDQRRVFVLIDDYDFAIRSAMFTAVDGGVLDSVIQFSGSMTNTLLKRNGRYVQGGLMTGVWDIPAVGVPVHNTRDPDSFQIYRFLDDHRFVDYYGATKQEVEHLIENPKLQHSIENLATRYNGFLSKWGTIIYNIYSIINYAGSGELNNFWTMCKPKRYLKELIHITYVKNNITELLQNETIYIEAVDKLTVDDFLLFRNITTNKSFQVLDITRIFFFLFSEGYFTYKSGIIIQIDKETPKIGIRCPNDEIKEYFERVLRNCEADC